MVAPGILNPALADARAQSRSDRNTVHQSGMGNVLQNFRPGSAVWGTNRWADGLSGIDAAVAALDAQWPAPPAVPVWATVDPLVAAVLNACTAWLGNRQICGLRVTGWREAAIRKLYWQVAWAYNFKQYAIAANATANARNALGQITGMDDVVLPAGVVNPFRFAASGYTFEAPVLIAAPPGGRVLAAGHVIRGDTRGPLNIANANGFQGWNIGVAGQYSPWFDQNAGDDVQSVTTDQALTINAARAGKLTGGHKPRLADAPAWVGVLGGGPAGAAAHLAAFIRNLKGYIYEINTGGPANACRVTGTTPGREYIYLGLPAAIILNWWAIDAGGRTYGPIAFPAPANDPNLAWSAANVLA